MSVYAGFRTEFMKKGQHSLEMCGYGEEEQVNFFAAYDSEYITQWLELISKAVKFAEWFSDLKELRRL